MLVRIRAYAGLVRRGSVVVALVIAGCTGLPVLETYESPAYGQHCPASWKLVCIVDRPTLMDRPAVPGGSCRCTPLPAIP